LLLECEEEVEGVEEPVGVSREIKRAGDVAEICEAGET
jgi:hypothetical protein